MKIPLLLGGILLLGLLLKFFMANRSNKNRRSAEEIPSQKITNDKIVFIENAKLEDVKNGIQAFCDNYNQKDWKALPLLAIVSDDKCIVTFPFDIDFITYCFFVNYMQYQNEMYKPLTIGWTSTKQSDDWMTTEIVNKKVMLYVPVDDKDYDNVYLTTSDNIGYKMGFASGEEKQKLNSPRRTYTTPINIDQLNIIEEIQYK